jgi:type II secretory pathway pseudopilin PulG
VRAINIMSGVGYSLVELLFVTSLCLTLSAIAVPQTLVGLDDVRTEGAARYIATRFQRARMEAVMQSTAVAVQFSQDAGSYTYAMYVDGNRNGVLTRDIQRGADRRLGAVERLPDEFTGVDFGALPGLPAVDSGGTPPGADPIRLGAGNLVSFSATGTSSSGSVYIRGRRTAQFVVRVLGETGKTRVLKFDGRSRQWKPL